ncbi:MAG: hypothetical protein GXY44_09180 [Phycisphaerales bacterium]|nr:hypothetical protein [Phycisphaerales bacterium]
MLGDTRPPPHGVLTQSRIRHPCTPGFGVAYRDFSQRLFSAEVFAQIPVGMAARRRGAGLYVAVPHVFIEKRAEGHTLAFIDKSDGRQPVIKKIVELRQPIRCILWGGLIQNLAR